MNQSREQMAVDTGYAGLPRAATPEPKSVPETEIAISQLRSLVQTAELIENQAREISDRLFGSSPRVATNEHGKVATPVAFFQMTSDLAVTATTVLNEVNNTLAGILLRLGA